MSTVPETVASLAPPRPPGSPRRAFSFQPGGIRDVIAHAGLYDLSLGSRRDSNEIGIVIKLSKNEAEVILPDRNNPLELEADLTKSRILVACFPKSGSSFLSQMIGQLPGFEYVAWVPTYGRREQELCEDCISKCKAPRQVSQLHVRANEHTLSIIEKYNIETIVLVRNIFDATVSMADHISNESCIVPIAFFDERIAALPLSERIDAVIDLALPWYFNFYASWQNALPSAVCSYEDIIHGGPERQSTMLQRVGLNASPHEIKIASVKARHNCNTRFNVGRKGRGAEVLTTRQKHRIAQMASYYPAIDFAPIGSPSSRRKSSGLFRRLIPMMQT